jgi:tetratricopeptide (TPR) repeat protein/mRNA-degrading endonuclease RelE of RelBE toxin-antitoxin system
MTLTQYTNPIQVSITTNAREKLYRLPDKARSRFLNKIRCVVNGEACTKQFQQLHQTGTRTLFRIRYNRNLRIIASLVKDSPRPSYLKILDFVSHDDMDRGLFCKNGQEFTVLDIAELLTELTPVDDEEITNSSLWGENYQLNESIDFQSHPNDFWLLDPRLQQDPDLQLSSEQYNIVECELPLLLTGSAGSGKTTIGIYLALQDNLRALQENQEFSSCDLGQRKILYVTYNRFLKDYSQSIARKLLPQLHEMNHLEIDDFTSLCKKIGKRKRIFQQNHGFRGEQQINQQKFVEKFYKHRAIAGVDPIAMWQEIRHLIKGYAHSDALEMGLISESTYLSLAATHSTLNLPPNGDYQRVYDLAVQYQNWLQSQGYWDELDLTHQLLINSSHQEQYDAIYCDEVQDLTEIQIQFLLSLMKSDRVNVPRFFLTGDPAQVINPSGFKWSKITSLIHQNYSKLPSYHSCKQSLQPQQLTKNFRCNASIVDFGQQILNVLRQQNPLLDELQFPVQKAVRPAREKPLLIAGVDEKSILNGRNSFGERNAIIVTNDADKNKLIHHFSQNGIKTERVLTVQEVKGLEFDEVLVWNFFSHSDNWKYRRNSQIQELESFKYTCLYVCTTRARNKLYFYEENAHAFCQSPEIQSFIQKATPQELKGFFEQRDIESLLQSAHEYEEMGSYKQAIENYLRAGRSDLAMKPEALLHEQEGDWEKAGDIWNKLSKWDEAYRCWKEVNSELWLDKWQGISGQEWTERGRFLEQLKNYRCAFQCYLKSNDVQGQIRCLEERDEWHLLGDKYLEMSQYSEAQTCYEIAAEEWERIYETEKAMCLYQKVADTCERQNNWHEAAKAWQRSNRLENAARCYEKLERWQEAALIWEELEQWILAAKMWHQLNQLTQAAECYERGEYWQDAALIWENLNSWQQAAKAWEKVGNLYKVAECYEKAECWLGAAVIWEQQEAWPKAARAWQQIAGIWNQKEVWQRAAQAWQQAEEIKEAAICYEKAECWSQAEECWIAINQWSKVAILREKQVAEAWKQAGEFNKVAECYERIEKWQARENAKSSVQWFPFGKRSRSISA